MDLHDFAARPKADRDAAYDNAGAVRDSAAYIACWTEASARLRAAKPGHLDLPYGPRPRNRWDLYPAASPFAPCLVFIHGGYWQRNSKEVFACMGEGVLAHGWAAALPGYTLGPDATLSAIVAEIRAALDWLGAEGPAHGLAGPVILSGWSAGGHLTAMALDHVHVTAGLAISGVFELAPIALTSLNDKLHLQDGEVAALSPLRLPATRKPLDIAYGTAELDALVANSRAFYDLREAGGAPGRLLPVSGANHFDILEQLRRPDGKLVEAVRALA
jgi:acetyl esterase/lipase